ncbi:MAG: hypothetical protein WD066_15850 [Planctomycetaceae bacterium]
MRSPVIDCPQYAHRNSPPESGRFGFPVRRFRPFMMSWQASNVFRSMIRLYRPSNTCPLRCNSPT